MKMDEYVARAAEYVERWREAVELAVRATLTIGGSNATVSNY